MHLYLKSAGSFQPGEIWQRLSRAGAAHLEEGPGIVIYVVGLGRPPVHQRHRQAATKGRCGGGGESRGSVRERTSLPPGIGGEQGLGIRGGQCTRRPLPPFRAAPRGECGATVVGRRCGKRPRNGSPYLSQAQPREPGELQSSHTANAARPATG